MPTIASKLKDHFAVSLGVLVTALALASSSFAVEAAGSRVRGTISDLSGSVATITTAAGQSVKVTLIEPVVLLYRDIKFEDVPANAYVAVPSIALADGSRRALGLIVFPEKMRGFNEGFSAWDLGPDSKMTNATVAQVVARGGERVVTVKYGAEEQTVFVPPYAPISTFAPAPDKKFEVGSNVVLFADDKTGSLTAKFVGMHENGGLPPL